MTTATATPDHNPSDPGTSTSTSTACLQLPDPDEPPVDGMISVDDVKDGDAVFLRRLGPLQSLCDRAGEWWRHVAIATSCSGVPLIAEVAGGYFRLRPLAQAVANSEAAAVARVDASHRQMARDAARWCVQHSASEQVFAWEDFILAGFIATSRRYCLPDDRNVLERGVLAAIDTMGARPVRPEAVGYTCSAFVATAFAECGHPIDFDLLAPRASGERPSVFELVRGRRPLRAASETHLTPGQLATAVRALVTGVVATSGRWPAADHDERHLIRWVSPGDIWRSASFAQRYYVAG